MTSERGTVVDFPRASKRPSIAPPEPIDMPPPTRGRSIMAALTVGALFLILLGAKIAAMYPR